jgi:hypothetical protein
MKGFESKNLMDEWRKSAVCEILNRGAMNRAEWRCQENRGAAFRCDARHGGLSVLGGRSLSRTEQFAKRRPSLQNASEVLRESGARQGFHW